MTKGNGKRFKRKGKKIGGANATIKKVKVPEVNPTVVPTPYTEPDDATASDPETKSDSGVAQKKMENEKRLSGFIFMCNPSTKLECYQYRVFGLPSGKNEVVEEIKPGTKLFLFDFELKLLYGIYEATSAGKLNLEPAAFRGKFPAQVKFKIFKECLPLPESSLRHLIMENYAGSKFKQDLSKKQVKKLLSSFRPLTASTSQSAPSSSQSACLARANLWARPPSAMQNQFKHAGLPAMEVPYLAERQYNRIPTAVEPQPIPKVNFLQHGYHRTASYMEHISPNLDHRSLPATSSYFASSQRSSFAEDVAHGFQDPPHLRYRIMSERTHDQVIGLNRRYTTVQNIAPRDQVTIYKRQYHQLPLHRGALYQDNAAAYNSNPAAPNQYTASATQPHGHDHPPYYPMPLQMISHYQDSVVAYNSNPAAPPQYTAPILQPGDPTTYHQLPLHGETLYQENLVPYNSHPSAAAPYTTSAAAPYTSSASQLQVLAPGLPQGSAPITSYYAYSMANQSH